MWILAEYQEQAAAAVPVSEGNTVRGLSAPPQQQQQQQLRQELQHQQPRQEPQQQPQQQPQAGQQSQQFERESRGPVMAAIDHAHDDALENASLEREGALARGTSPSIEELDEQASPKQASPEQASAGQLNTSQKERTGSDPPTTQQVRPPSRKSPPAEITVTPASPASPTAARKSDLKELVADQKEKLAEKKEKLVDKKEKFKHKVKPPGGYDKTPFADVPEPGWTVRFVFHRATNLPVADYHNQSCDPFILATLAHHGPRRHEEDPPLTHQTPTVHRSIEPTWEDEWVVANVPSTGFRLKCRLYDEDFPDKNDRLGNVTVVVPRIDDAWQGFEDAEFEVKKRSGSKRAYFLKGVTSAWQHAFMTPRLNMSIQVLGRSESRPYAQVYTVGPTTWTKHYSPLFGRLLGIKVNKDEGEDARSSDNPSDKKYQKYDFQANEMQLSGPMPPELYHRYVEFTPLIGKLFTAKGIRGHILNKALHKQHNRVYSFNRSTERGQCAPESDEAAMQFLRMCHFDDGHRIFTYVLTLDGLLRFTETGTEFGIDLLSKHTMHSDAATYIACSGEFFVRRVRPRGSRSSVASVQQVGGGGGGGGGESSQARLPTSPVEQQEERRRPASSEAAPASQLQLLAAQQWPQSPAPAEAGRYQLVIDNDSGTYRPDKSVLPRLAEFLQRNFPGLHVRAMHWEDERLKAMKRALRERKKRSGLVQVRLAAQDRSPDSSSISSDDASRLEHLEGFAAGLAAGEGEGVEGGGGAGLAAVEDRFKSKKEKALDAVMDPHGVNWRSFVPKIPKKGGKSGEAAAAAAKVNPAGEQDTSGEVNLGETGDDAIVADDDVEEAALATRAGATDTSRSGEGEPSPQVPGEGAQPAQ